MLRPFVAAPALFGLAALAGLAGLTGLVSPARADGGGGTTIVSSLNLPPDFDAIADFDTPSAQEFSTGNLAYTLTGVQINGYGTTPGMKAVAYLRADDPVNDAPLGGTSGILATFNAITLPSTNQTLLFTPATNFTLAANTQYWFTFAASPATGGDAYWTEAASDTPIIGPGTLPDNVAQSFDSGSTWQSYPGSDPFQIEVDGTSVAKGSASAPEPGSLALSAFAILAPGAFKLSGRARQRRWLRRAEKIL